MSARAIATVMCGVSLLALGSSPAVGQQAAQPAASGGTALEEIVVTARRREEKLQSVPVAITAFTPAQLQAKGIETASDLQHYVPSLLTSQQTRDQQVFYIRGEGPNGGQGGAQGVITYFAEVPFNGAGPGIYFDLDNLQVLRGPQGTLFGRNTTGGAILFEPKKPTNEYEGYLQFTAGNYNRFGIQGAVNIPIISDQLMVRVAGEREQRDGFTHDITTGQDLDNRDYWSGRIGVTWRPTDDFDNYLVYDTHYSDTSGTGITLEAINPDVLTSVAGTFPWSKAPATYHGPTLQQVLAQQAALGPRGVATSPGEPGPIDKTYSWGIADVAKWDVNDNITLKNIAAYREIKNLLRYDIDGTPLKIIDFTTPGGWNLNNAQYTEELQAQGKSTDGNLNWIVGAFGEFLHPAGSTLANLATSVNPFGPKPNPVPGGPPIIPVPIGTFLIPISVFSNGQGTNALGPEGGTERTEAIFAQETYNLGGLLPALDGLKFTAGVRYTWDYVSNSNFQTVVVGPSNLLPYPGHILTLTCDSCVYKNHTYQAPTWTIGLDYQVDPDTLVYVHGSRGFKAGGFNGAGAAQVNLVYDSEYVTDVEIGLKSDWDLYGIKARTNVDAYHDDYRNAQRAVGVLVQLTPAPAAKTVTTLIANGNAEVEGLEFEGTLLPFTGFELNASWAYTHARYTKFVIPTIGDRKDLPYPFVSKNKFGFTGTYLLPFIPEEWGDVHVEADYTHTGRVQYATADIEPFGNEPGYGLVNVRLDWNNIAGYPVDAAFFMTNVTDNLVKLGNYGIYTSNGLVSAVWNEPQMWGFQLKYRFHANEEAPPEAAPYVPPPAQPPAAPVARSYMVFFDFDKSDLTQEAVSIVDQAAKNASPAKATEITVTGHTDTVGSDAYNMRLGKRRAESVAAQLEKDGIPSSEIALISKGKRDLLVPTKDGVREPQNRRVTIVYDGPTS